jgi:hypothetical protein
VYDPRAQSIPDIGLLKVVDAETGHEMFIDTSLKKLRHDHEQAWKIKEVMLKEMFAKSRVDWTRIATNQDFVQSLLLLFKRRN